MQQTRATSAAGLLLALLPAAVLVAAIGVRVAVGAEDSWQAMVAARGGAAATVVHRAVMAVAIASWQTGRCKRLGGRSKGGEGNMACLWRVRESVEDSWQAGEEKERKEAASRAASIGWISSSLTAAAMTNVRE